jgi:hypothetical protein
MSDSVLYFPMIRPPRNEWFSRVLLYWDRVGTILPKKYSQDHAFLRPYTSALLAAELLTPIAPDESVWQSGADNYRKAFLDLVDRDPFGIEQTQAGERKWTRVHLDKTGTGLALDLQDRKLAKNFESPEHAAWIEVEERTADLLMAFLASIVGKDEQVAMDPITDSEAAVAAFTTLPEEDRQIGTELEPIRYALLGDILPGPAAGVEPATLAQFKNDHHHLLTGFRNRVERKAIDCAQITDRRLQQEMVGHARHELIAEIDEIERRMGERQWPLAARGALGVVIAALGVADLAVSGGTVLGVASGGLGLAGSVDAAFQGRRRRDVFENPLAYSALARREFVSVATG